MLVLAADALESGHGGSRFDLVMVDEFQDASQARARMTRGLVNGPGRFLLAVGDDWQSINRFAGADLSVMTSFEDWFGRGPTLRLQTTFRCPQSICDVASAFVAKNPRQLDKQVTSAQPDRGAPVRLLRVGTEAALTPAIQRYLDELASSVRNGSVAPGISGRVSVDILGRYRHDQSLRPARTPPELEVTFRTVHGSKGLEADYVVLPNVSRGRFGFPSLIVDDPVLNLAMAQPDDYPHAEERRLLYVALTRARRGVVLVAVDGQESSFVVELLADGLLEVSGTDSGPPTTVCPGCQRGTLVRREGPHGDFLGCSTFPKCRQTARVGLPVASP